jgi:anti-sigma factor RsiW
VTKTCRELSSLLSAHLDGELAVAEESALREHLAGCTACRAELESLRRLAESVAARTEPDPFFVTRFRALRDSDPWAKPEPWRRLALRLLPFAAAAVLGAFVAVWQSQPPAALGELESGALGEASLIALDTEADPVLRIALEPFPEAGP